MYIKKINTLTVGALSLLKPLSTSTFSAAFHMENTASIYCSFIYNLFCSSLNNTNLIPYFLIPHSDLIPLNYLVSHENLIPLFIIIWYLMKS